MKVRAVLQRLEPFRQLITYAVVGAAATVAYAVAFYLVRPLTPFGDGVDSIIAYGGGMLVSYLGHSRLTFQSKDASSQVARFLIVAAIGVAMSFAVMDWLVPSGGLPVWAGVGIICVAVPLLNFVAYKLWVFTGAGS